MNWFVGTFYLHPITVAFTVIAVYLPIIVVLSRKNRDEALKATAAIGLKPVSTNMLVRYLNNTSCTCMNSAFDGSRAMAPVIEDVFRGDYAGHAVSLFTFVLPTGRTGTRQTVVHLRSEANCLPRFSLIDEVHGKKLSEMFRCSHATVPTAADNRYAGGHGAIDHIKAQLARTPVLDISMANLRSPVQGLVVDSTGTDLYCYQHGRTVEPGQYRQLIDRFITFQDMLKNGDVDLDLFKESEREKAASLFICAKNLLIACPALLAIPLFGYGYVFLATLAGALLLLFFIVTRVRLSQCR